MSHSTTYVDEVRAGSAGSAMRKVWFSRCQDGNWYLENHPFLGVRTYVMCGGGWTAAPDFTSCCHCLQYNGHVSPLYRLSLCDSVYERLCVCVCVCMHASCS